MHSVNIAKPSYTSHSLIKNSGLATTIPSESWVDFGDGQKSLINIDSIYPVETQTKIPDIP